MLPDQKFLIGLARRSVNSGFSGKIQSQRCGQTYTQSSRLRDSITFSTDFHARGKCSVFAAQRKGGLGKTIFEL